MIASLMSASSHREKSSLVSSTIIAPAFDTDIPAMVASDSWGSQRGRSKRRHNGQLPHRYPLSHAFRNRTARTPYERAGCGARLQFSSLLPKSRTNLLVLGQKALRAVQRRSIHGSGALPGSQPIAALHWPSITVPPAGSAMAGWRAPHHGQSANPILFCADDAGFPSSPKPQHQLARCSDRAPAFPRPVQ